MVSSQANTNCGDNPITEQMVVEQDRVSDFGYFDRLPPVLKERLNNALFPFCAKMVYEAFQKFGLKNTLAIIQRTEQKLSVPDDRPYPPHR